MESQKQVKIIGLSVLQDFGALKATELKFDERQTLYAVKGEVGSGKTTLNKAMRLTTQGSDTLIDKNLYGGPINMVTQLIDGDKKIFVGCKSETGESLTYFLYEEDKDGNKIKNPVIDGVKATPAAYLKSMQTALTWRLNELTSENPTVQRNILLELYSSELEKKGVVFNKNSPNYVGGVIDEIEKSKAQRSYLDMKRKEVGGIADDLNKKGVDYKDRKTLIDISILETSLQEQKAKKQLALDNPGEEKEKELLKLKNEGLQINAVLKDLNQKIKDHNIAENKKKEVYDSKLKTYNKAIDDAKTSLISVASPELDFQIFEENFDIFIEKNTVRPKEPKLDIKKELQYNNKGSCISKADDFEDKDIKKALSDYLKIGVDYSRINKQELKEVDTKKYDTEIERIEKDLKGKKQFNDDAVSVNAYHDWKDSNEKVNELNKKFFMLLSGIDTGVKGLHIAPEYDVDKDGQKVAKGNDIYLMYDGVYDPEYFSNEDGELRKLSAYSDTQKPMICLLIQRYLLSKKSKILPYLWIDQVPIDKKTKALLDRMSHELGLWLFVNWTGDFDKENLQDGEILIENGEIFQKTKIDESN